MRELTIFAKKRTTADGKKFYSYLTRLTRKNGETIVASVKFREDCGTPDGKECPMVIEVPDGCCNFNQSIYNDEASGMKLPSYTLWVSDWRALKPYIDTSMDEFI